MGLRILFRRFCEFGIRFSEFVTSRPRRESRSEVDIGHRPTADGTTARQRRLTHRSSHGNRSLAVRTGELVGLGGHGSFLSDRRLPAGIGGVPEYRGRYIAAGADRLSRSHGTGWTIAGAGRVRHCSAPLELDGSERLERMNVVRKQGTRLSATSSYLRR